MFWDTWKNSEAEFHKHLKYKMLELEGTLAVKWSKTHSLGKETFGQRNTSDLYNIT